MNASAVAKSIIVGGGVQDAVAQSEIGESEHRDDRCHGHPQAESLRSEITERQRHRNQHGGQGRTLGGGGRQGGPCNIVFSDVLPIDSA